MAPSVGKHHTTRRVRHEKSSEPRFSTCPAARRRRPCASLRPRLLTYHAEMRPDS